MNGYITNYILYKGMSSAMTQDKGIQNLETRRGRQFIQNSENKSF